MTKLYLIRHAEAEGNIYRRAHGHYNGQITGRGYLQIEQLCDRFADEKLDAVYSSDLTRARVTATALAESQGLPLNITDRLREVSVGIWEDLSWAEIAFTDPEMSVYFRNDPARWDIPCAENYENLCARITGVITEIAENHTGGTVAMISHGVAIRAFTCEVLGIQSHMVGENAVHIDNTSVMFLTYDNGKFTIEYSGDNSHLSEELSTLAGQKWWRDGSDMELRYIPNSQPGSFAAICGDNRVGTIAITKVDGDAGLLKKIYLEPEFRQKGIAIQLLGQAVSEARKLNLKKLRIQVEQGSPAEKFCLKYGFVPSADGFLEKDISQKQWD